MARLAVPIPVGRLTARIRAGLHIAAAVVVVVPVDPLTAGMIAAAEGAALPEVPHRRPIPVTAAGLVLRVTDDPSVAVPVDLIRLLLPKRFGLLRRRMTMYRLELLTKETQAWIQVTNKATTIREGRVPGLPLLTGLTEKALGHL